jgi:site-specific DNA recombinase
MPRKPRVVIYLRLSESDDASTSITRQEADLRLLADREGWDVVLVLIDDGLSGGKTRKKAVQALDMLRSGQADVLAVWKFDRWSRQGLGAVAQLIDALDENPGSLFVADRDGLRSSLPAWRIIASVLAEAARMERENIQIRVRSSIAELKRTNRYSGGVVPYGYQTAENPDGPGRVLVLHAEETEVVREIARRYLAGESLHQIAKSLNERHIMTRKARRWSAGTLQQMLLGEAVVGRVQVNGDVLCDADGLPISVWPPVLDLETWHRVRTEIEADKSGKTPRRHRRRARRLSGIATCGECTRPLYIRSGGPTNLSYCCSAKANGQECTGAGIKAEALEEWVTARFLETFGHREVMECIEELPDLAALADTEAAITATAGKMTRDDADVAALSSTLAVLKERRADLKSRPTERVVRLVPTGQSYGELWRHFMTTDQDRSKLLADNIAVLAVKKGGRGGRNLIDFGRVTLMWQPDRLTDDASTGADRVYVTDAA